MKKGCITLFIVVLGWVMLHGQNLVVNGNFDQFTVCPDDEAQLDRAEAWTNPSNGSPDYFHRCAGAGPCLPCVPNYLWFTGVQEPHSGNGFAGIFIYFDRGREYREYLRTQLQSPLRAGESYEFSMYINLSDGSEVAASAPQIHLSTDNYTSNTNGGFFNVQPQIDFDTIVTARDEWVRLSACYTASGGEEYMTIGNFRRDADTDETFLGDNEEPYPYYLIDDISLYPSAVILGNLIPDTLKGCEGDTINLELPSDLDYLWSDGSRNSSKDFFESGTYVLEVISECIDPALDTMVVIFDNQLDLNLPDSVFICENGSVTLKPGGQVDNWLWSDGSTADSLVITQPGLYWVEAMNVCETVRDSIWATRILDPVSQLPRDTFFCSGDSIWLVADPNFNPVWEGQVRSDSFLVSSGGAYVLELSNFCGIVTDVIIVNELPAPEINFSEERTFCQGDSLFLQVEVVADEWSWFDGTQDSAKWITRSGWIWVEAEAECGSRRDSVFIEETSLPSSPFDGDTILCSDETWEINLSNDFSILWQDGSQSSTYIINESGQYWVELSNDCGQIRDTIEVDVIDPPSVDLGPDLNICAGDSVVLVYNGPDQWQWSTGTSDSILIVYSEGKYGLTVSNACGDRTDSVFIKVDDQPILNIPESFELCDGDSDVITPQTNLDEWVWSDGTQNGPLIISQAGIFTVDGANACGEISDTVQVQVNPLPSVFVLPEDPVLCEGDSLVLTAESRNANFMWAGQGVNEAQLLITTSGSYIVEAANECGILMDTILVESDFCGCNVFVPNAFSPNGDNINDRVEVFSDCKMENLKVSIFNRWGELMFVSNDQETFWDGTFQGELLSPDVFVYVVTFDVGRQPLMYTGDITLIR